MEKIKELIKHVAPTLASALSGPFAGVATKYLTDKLAGENIADDKNIEDVLVEKLKEPATLLKLKDVDKEFEIEMRKLDVDIFKLEVNDRKDARNYSKTDNKPQIIISLLFLSAYFLMLAAIFTVEISDTLNMQKGENSLMGELQILFGVLTAGVGQILSFWFGGVLKKSDNSKDQ